ncbi:MAG: hypothetical protein IT304_12795, partial [Dehalococcoidia bacterium]|nr:hypothetical protein [Dehalococcoidia bacterium]
MRFCLKPNTVSTDPAARIGYCLATGIETVQESASAVPGFAEERQLEVRALKAQIQPYLEAGLTVEAMGLGQVTPEVVLGKPEGREDFARLCHDVVAMAEVGIRTIISVPPISEQPTEEANREQLKRVADYYQRVCAIAERAGVRLATHSPWPPPLR